MSQECFGIPFDDTQLPFTEDERLEQEEDAREDAGLDDDYYDYGLGYEGECIGDPD